VSVVFAEREQVRQRLKTPEGKVLYRLRQQTVERVIAQLKANLRFNRFGLAGVGGAGAEFWLVCMAHNLLAYLQKAAAAANKAARPLAGRLANRIASLFQWPWRRFRQVGVVFR
jgi:hypothetical protein